MIIHVPTSERRKAAYTSQHVLTTRWMMGHLDENVLRFAAQRVRRALLKTKVTVTPRAFRHLVGVVCLPVRDRWFRDPHVYESLTAWYRRGTARTIGSPERAHLLGHVGDASLLVCGFWWEQHALSRNHDDRDVQYLLNLGRRSYHNIGEEPYPELASNFPRLADAMTVLAAQYTASGNRRLLGPGGG